MACPYGGYGQLCVFRCPFDRVKLAIEQAVCFAISSRIQKRIERRERYGLGDGAVSYDGGRG